MLTTQRPGVPSHLGSFISIFIFVLPPSCYKLLRRDHRLLTPCLCPASWPLPNLLLYMSL